MAASTIYGKPSRGSRLLRWLLAPLQGTAAALLGTDLNVVAITAATVMLCGIGLLSIFMAEIGNPDNSSRALHQGTYVIAAIAIMVLVSMIDYRRWGQIAYPAFAITLLLLALLLAAKVLNHPNALMRPKYGAWRWIDLGPFQLQPSEFAKITYIMALAWYLRYRTNYRTLAGLIWPLGLTMLPMVLILLEPDLGSVLLLLPVFFSMLLVAGAKRRHLLSLLLICVVAAPVLYRTMHDYQRMRVLGAVLQSESARTWLLDHPRALSALKVTRVQVDQWQKDQGFQLDRSKVTLATGGLLGIRDADADCMQYDYLPEWHTDFIFAVIGHKWGLVGCCVVLLCYGMILVSGCRISAATNEPFGRLLAVGVVSLLSTQAAVNVGMAVGLLPVTGTTLPFVSYGGSSLTATGAIMGLLLSIGVRKPMMLAPEPFIFEDVSARIGL
jgi:rod shape determining protein RodA